MNERPQCVRQTLLNPLDIWAINCIQVAYFYGIVKHNHWYIIANIYVVMLLLSCYSLIVTCYKINVLEGYMGLFKSKPFKS